ncbi:rod binding protein [Litoreibacter meonggei]|uniref:Rod binding protein n=1 Tax=Litoreibacter meonggei TaxID=1049199 RepID=A0A497VC78_9RHOB|nr:rod-binding protein [Litoreibacter meonggei]RLJ41201.1 rod binding protein [Litoreibacter meonggei]
MNRNQDIAKKLEVAFVSEMLSFIGMKGMSSEFGGGIGEDQFQSFLRQQHAELIVESGGLGLAEQFVASFGES